MDLLRKIGDSALRLLESNNDEVIVFLAIFLFIFLGKSAERDSPEEYARMDSGTIIFLVAFVVVLLLFGSSREEDNPE